MSSGYEVKKVFTVAVYTSSKFDWEKKFFAINSYLRELASVACDFSVVEFDTAKAIINKGRVSREWYDSMITSNAKTDITCLHFDRKTWRALKGDKSLNGLYFDDNDGVSEMYIIADERQTKVRGKRWDAFTHTFLHELAHCLYSLGGQSITTDETKYVVGDDNTHYFDKVKQNIDLVWKDMNFIKDHRNIVQTVIDFLKKKTTPNPSISQMAEAVKKFEGWFTPGTKGYPRGSVSFRNNNPGNLRWSPFESGNVNNFSVFKTYEDGWKALIHQIRIAVNGKSKVYKPTDTLFTFFSKYAPSSDNNYPDKYAKFVAKELGVSPEFVVGNLRDL